MTVRIQVDAREIEYNKHLMYRGTETPRVVRNTTHTATLEWSIDAPHVREWIDWGIEFLPVKSESWHDQTSILSRLLKGDPLKIQSTSEDGLRTRILRFKPLS